MVSVKKVNVVRRNRGVESEVQVTIANGEAVTAADAGLSYISYVKAVVTPAGYVAGGASVTDPDSIGNQATFTLYEVASTGSLVAAGSIDCLITLVQM